MSANLLEGLASEVGRFYGIDPATVRVDRNGDRILPLAEREDLRVNILPGRVETPHFGVSRNSIGRGSLGVSWSDEVGFDALLRRDTSFRSGYRAYLNPSTGEAFSTVVAFDPSSRVGAPPVRVMLMSGPRSNPKEMILTAEFMEGHRVRIVPWSGLPGAPVETVWHRVTRGAGRGVQGYFSLPILGGGTGRTHGGGRVYFPLFPREAPNLHHTPWQSLRVLLDRLRAVGPTFPRAMGWTSRGLDRRMFVGLAVLFGAASLSQTAIQSMGVFLAGSPVLFPSEIEHAADAGQKHTC